MKLDTNILSKYQQKKKKKSTNIKTRMLITDSEISWTRKIIDALFFVYIDKMKYSPLILFNHWTFFIIYIKESNVLIFDHSLPTKYYSKK